MIHRTTLRHIATAAGVSTATVSMALRNSPRITPATRDRVLKFAADLNYQPDPLIAALAHRRSGRAGSELGTIAYVTAFPTREGWKRNRFSPAVYEGACLHAAKQGYRVEHFWLRAPGMSGRRLSSILRARGIRGLCVAPLPAGFGHLNLDWDHFCCASVGYSMVRPSLHRACPHHFQGMLMTLRNLRRLGYRRIGVALEKRVSQIVVHNWQAGILVFQNTYGPASVSCYMYEKPDRKELEQWMEKHRPDAMVASDVALLPWIENRGRTIPGELGVVALERYPGYAGLDQKPATVGAAAIDLVIGMIQRNETGLPADPKVVMVEGGWIEGPSIRPPA